MAPDQFFSAAAPKRSRRPDVPRPEPEPYIADDSRDAVRATLHSRLSEPGAGTWDYVESYVRGRLLIVRLRHDEDGPIAIEVPLEDPVDPDAWQLLDTWIVEFMDTGRAVPVATSDAEIRYRLD